jgi:hypothetical protein
VGYEAEASDQGQRLIRLEDATADLCIPSPGDGVMVGTAWIDRPVDTQGLRSCFHVFLSAAWKRSHAQANDRHSSHVFAMPSKGFARTSRNG